MFTQEVDFTRIMYEYKIIIINLFFKLFSSVHNEIQHVGFNQVTGYVLFLCYQEN